MRHIRAAVPAGPAGAAAPRQPVRLRPIDWITSAVALIFVLSFTSLVALPASAGGAATGSAGSAPVPRIVANDGMPASDFPAVPGPTGSPSASATWSPGATPTQGTPAHPGSAAAPTPRPAATPRPTPKPAGPLPSCGTSLQSLIDAAAAGSTVHVGACTYHEAVTINKPLTLQGPAVVDGDNQRTRGISVRANNVTIDGLTVQRINDPDYVGAIDVQSVSGFTLRNAVVRNSAIICLVITNSSGARVLSSELTGCGKEGFFLGSDKGVTLQGDRIHGNNLAGHYDTGWEAGGGKASGSSNVVFKGNYAYGNNGPGLWCDGGCSNVTFSGNRVYGNSRAGIMVEISSGATISGNAVWENGWGFTTWGWGAGILVSSSAAVSVSGNTVAWNADGIAVISQNRGSAAWNDVHDVSVHDNTIVMAPQPGDGSDVMGLAWLQDWSGVLFAAGSHNGGSGNDYWWSGAVPRCGYEWNGCSASLSAFNATPGDEGGVAISSATKVARLSAAGIPAAPHGH